MVKLIILDFDGTLGDTRANIVLTMRQTLAKLGYPEQDEETIAATIGVPLEKGFEQMLPGFDADGVLERIIEKVDTKNAAGQILEG